MHEIINSIPKDDKGLPIVGQPGEDKSPTLEQDPSRDGLGGIPGTGPGTGTPVEIQF